MTLSRLRDFFCHHARRDERGAMAIVIALLCAFVIPMAAVVIDISYIYNAQRQLQISADAAALAGAQYINCCTTAGTATTKANLYSGVSGNKNAVANLPVTMASGYPQLACLTSVTVSCSGADNANAITVKEQVTLPLFFGKFISITNATLTATATASAKGGGLPPLNVVIILDTTQSMNTTDSSCSATRIDCALKGVQTLLKQLWPSVDNVALMAFPGLTASIQAQYDYDCASSPSPSIANYSASPVYQILGLSNDYRTSNNAATLNSSSNLVRAVGGGGSGCGQGIDAVGGVGTYYADAITAAQTLLTAHQSASVQNVIIFVSDGDASATAAQACPASTPACSKATNQCQQGITAAQAAATAGTWVYSIAYGASTSSSGSCSNDSPSISACSAMKQIASATAKFYSDTVGGSSSCTSSANSVSSLSSIFQSVGNSLTVTRLLPTGSS